MKGGVMLSETALMTIGVEAALKHKHKSDRSYDRAFASAVATAIRDVEAEPLRKRIDQLETHIRAINDAVENMDLSMVPLGDEWIQVYQLSASPWHKVLGLTRGFNLSTTGGTEKAEADIVTKQDEVKRLRDALQYWQKFRRYATGTNGHTPITIPLWYALVFEKACEMTDAALEPIATERK